MKFKDNGKRKVINIDLDGILTSSGEFWNDNVEANEVNCERVRRLYYAGNIIIIHTARNWAVASETVGWLIVNKIPFHGIAMNKGGSDAYIDDKNTTFEELFKEQKLNDPKTTTHADLRP